MTNLPSNRGFNDSDEEEQGWGYRDRGLQGNGDGDDVQERGFEPRLQPE